MAQLRAWHLLAGTHLAAGLAGYSVAPRERLDSEVENTGLFSTDTRRTLAAAVLSLRREQKLLSYTWRGAVHVSAERSELLGLLTGTQDLTVPATVGYYVDLRRLQPEDVQFDGNTNRVNVHVPPLVLGEVAVQAERAVVRNGGSLTYSDRQVQELTRLNYGRVREAVIAAAQERTLVAIAQEAARANVRHQFEVALEAAGTPNVLIEVSFARR